jgi:hypothetical protein
MTRFKVKDFVALYPGASENADRAMKKHSGQSTITAAFKKAKKTK